MCVVQFVESDILPVFVVKSDYAMIAIVIKRNAIPQPCDFRGHSVPLLGNFPNYAIKNPT